jgi:hypothetical protein
MHPAFRSNSHAIAFCLLLLFLLGLPLILSWTTPPPSEQAFISISNRAGPIGADAAEMFEDPRDADVLFVGSSPVLFGIQTELVEKALSAHLGRPAHVVKLGNNWPGEDIHLFMLQDYFEHHRARLIVWMLPQPDGVHNLPHNQIYHLVRYPQYRTILAKLSLLERITLYGDMILGAPRELLSKVRPNLIGAAEKNPEYDATNRDPTFKIGYDGGPFIPDELTSASPNELYLTAVTSPTLTVGDTFLGKYDLNFIQEIVNLAQHHGSKLVFLHMPRVLEFGNNTIAQLAPWAKVIGPDHQMIGAPATVVFAGLSRERMLNFFLDDVHLNYNGKIAFTAKIIPSVLKTYDTVSSSSP